MDQESDAPAILSAPPDTYVAVDEVQPSRARRSLAKGKGGDSQWIQGRLKSLYDAVAAEPLTPELQELVDRLRSQP